MIWNPRRDDSSERPTKQQVKASVNGWKEVNARGPYGKMNYTYTLHYFLVISVDVVGKDEGLVCAVI